MAELEVIQNLEEDRNTIYGSAIGDNIEEEDVEEEEEEEDGVIVMSEFSPNPPHPEPIIIRGVGNFTLFGLNNKFDTIFPTPLSAKVAPEEFKTTIKHINSVLKRTTKTNLRWFICCSLLCCCTCCCSLWPVIYLNKRSIQSLEKALDCENKRLYNRLGLNWKLKFMKSDTTSMTEMVLMLEFLPRISFYRPD